MKRERATSISQPSTSTPLAEGPTATLAEGPVVTPVERSFVPPTKNLSVPPSDIEGSDGCSDDAVLALPIQRE